MTENLKMLAWFNRVLSLLGLLFFLEAYLFVTNNAQGFDMAVKSFVVKEVEKKTKASFSGQLSDRLAAANKALPSYLQRQLETVKAEIDAGVPDMVADIISAMCNLDCDRKTELQVQIRENWEAKLKRANIGFERAKTIIENHYKTVLEEVRRDIGIFLVSNLVLLSFSFALSLFKSQASAHLLPISSIIFAGTLLGSSWYIFGQNWFMAILYRDYWGWGYMGLLAFLFLLLLDIAFNRARVMTALLNFIGNAFGSVFAPC